MIQKNTEMVNGGLWILTVLQCARTKLFLKCNIVHVICYNILWPLLFVEMHMVPVICNNVIWFVICYNVLWSLLFVTM